MTPDPITKAIEALELECERTGPECHTQTVEALTALRQHKVDGEFTIADIDLANKAETAVSYLRLCPSAGSERLAAIETVLLAADRFSQVVPRIEITPAKESDDERA